MAWTGRLVRVGALIGVVTGRAYAQEPPAGAVVRIESPAAGIVDASETVRLRATVSDATVSTAQLDFNGVAYEVPVDRGVVEEELVPIPGNNRVVLAVRSGAVTARASTTFFLRVPNHLHLPVPPMHVVMSWDSGGSGLELAVSRLCRGGSEECELAGRFYGSWRGLTRADGAFGMQCFTASAPIAAGRYRVRVVTPASQGSDESDAWDRSIATLDEAERDLAAAPPGDRAGLLDRRRRAIADLDRWAQPTTLQTRVHVDVVLFANTPRERRWRFDRVVQRLGRSPLVGGFEITEAMLRAADEAEDGR
ncbi:MAG: hypothetical protein JWM10_4533 [Myxococcaceae bacterium]|nr:hypothetical protein [Myxococcaceae bacterium]